MSRIGVTGATGFIGAWLVKQLAASGNTVHALVRNPDNAKHIIQDNVKLFTGDVTDEETLNLAFQGCDEVYHVAALAKVWDKDPGQFELVNAVGTRNVLQACVNQGVQKVVITSSAGVYGPSVNGPVSENTRRTLPFFNEYERTKAEAESIAAEFAASGLKVVVVLPTRVFGPSLGRVPESLNQLIHLFVKGNWAIIPGDGKAIGNYVYIHDVVRGYILAMEKGRSGEKYLLGGFNISYNEFFRHLSVASGIRRKMWHLPVWVIGLVTRLQKWMALFGVEPKLTPDWLAKIKYNWAIDSTKAREELGYYSIDADMAFSENAKSIRETV